MMNVTFNKFFSSATSSILVVKKHQISLFHYKNICFNEFFSIANLVRALRTHCNKILLYININNICMCVCVYYECKFIMIHFDILSP